VPEWRLLRRNMISMLWTCSIHISRRAARLQNHEDCILLLYKNQTIFWSIHLTSQILLHHHNSSASKTVRTLPLFQSLLHPHLTPTHTLEMMINNFTDGNRRLNPSMPERCFLLLALSDLLALLLSIFFTSVFLLRQLC
jgi:hypothetical protein